MGVKLPLQKSLPLTPFSQGGRITKDFTVNYNNCQIFIILETHLLLLIPVPCPLGNSVRFRGRLAYPLSCLIKNLISPKARPLFLSLSISLNLRDSLSGRCDSQHPKSLPHPADQASHNSQPYSVHLLLLCQLSQRIQLQCVSV